MLLVDGKFGFGQSTQEVRCGSTTRFNKHDSEANISLYKLLELKVNGR